MEKLKAQTHDIKAINSRIISEMYALYSRYYDATNEERFTEDLRHKDYVVLLTDTHGSICGFTALEHYQATLNGKNFWVVYSGDTIVHHDYWGNHSLSLEWCRSAGHLKAKHPNAPLYWFLISKGHRTYRYLHAFARTYYPNSKSQSLEELKDLADYLAEKKFGDLYLKNSGLVIFPEQRGHLKTDWDDAKEYVGHNKEVRFFLNANPGYKKGDELVCLTELCEENFRSFGLDKFREGFYAKNME